MGIHLEVTADTPQELKKAVDAWDWSTDATVKFRQGSTNGHANHEPTTTPKGVGEALIDVFEKEASEKPEKPAKRRGRPPGSVTTKVRLRKLYRSLSPISQQFVRALVKSKSGRTINEICRRMKKTPRGLTSPIKHLVNAATAAKFAPGQLYSRDQYKAPKTDGSSYGYRLGEEFRQAVLDELEAAQA